MRRFRLWLARKLVGTSPFMANMTISDDTLTTGTDCTAIGPVWYATSAGPVFSFDGTNLMEDDMSKKKRSKAAGKAAAKAKTEKTQKRKAKGGKGAR